MKDKLFFFTSITPEFRNRELNLLTENGDGPSALFKAKNTSISAFNKLSWEPLRPTAHELHLALHHL